MDKILLRDDIWGDNNSISAVSQEDVTRVVSAFNDCILETAIANNISEFKEKLKTKHKDTLTEIGDKFDTLLRDFSEKIEELRKTIKEKHLTDFAVFINKSINEMATQQELCLKAGFETATKVIKDLYKQRRM